MIIQRDIYLQQLIESIGNGMIKIITGLRRCGKSFLLLDLFHNYLLSNGTPPSHIIEISLDDWANKELRNPDSMLEYVKRQITDDAPYYLCIDEVQLLDEFADILNSFLHIRNLDVYVTGSNSRFLSSDVVTEFRGRGDEIHIHPLCFREFVSAYSRSEEEAWEEYVLYGGLPALVSLPTPAKKTEYLKHLFRNVYMSDIRDRHDIRNEGELEELIDFLCSSVGSMVNPLKLSNTFKSVKNKTIQPRTIKNYLMYLQDAFLVNQCKRYDIKGKRYINTPVKYYFEDIGTRNAWLGFRQMESSHLMENIIYNELKVRGFEVDVGVVPLHGRDTDGRHIIKPLEVDFVANSGNRRYYIQSAFSMPTFAKKEQEERSLTHIPDSFRKIIITGDNFGPQLNENGILSIGIRKFLLNPNSLSE